MADDGVGVGVVHLDVAVQPGRGPIRGTVENRDGVVVAFAGWLELMSAFDTLSGGAAADADTDADAGADADRVR